ncbi:hypothetical protein CTAYLR_007123 [Chrysophaeum taylorii]|uniref:RBR-type E3 ubiquitin transferase n=1 Tax=Chrysophaeum taylorii TaxID=2483200 RepID=A0AAD7U764_9STRA|nr:hypothetical protein CTAYLR_007123 [Chrysophaeum taylorii]
MGGRWRRAMDSDSESDSESDSDSDWDWMGRGVDIVDESRRMVAKREVSPRRVGRRTGPSLRERWWDELDLISRELAEGEGSESFEALRLGSCWRIAALAHAVDEKGSAEGLGRICRWLSGATVKRLALANPDAEDPMGLGAVFRGVCRGLLSSGAFEALDEPLCASLCLRDMYAAYAASDEDSKLGCDVALLSLRAATRGSDQLAVGVALAFVETLARRSREQVSPRLVHAGVCELLVDLVAEDARRSRCGRDNLLLAARAIQALADRSPLARFALSLVDARRALVAAAADDDDLVRATCGRATAVLTEASVLLEVGVRNTIAELERRRWRAGAAAETCGHLGTRLGALYGALKGKGRRRSRLDGRLLTDFFDLVGVVDRQLAVLRVFDRRVVPAIEASANLISMVWTARLVLGRRGRRHHKFRLVDCRNLDALRAESDELWVCVGERLAAYEELATLRHGYDFLRPKYQLLRDDGHELLKADLAEARRVSARFDDVLAALVRVARPRLRAVALLARLGRGLPADSRRRSWARAYEHSDDFSKALPAIQRLFGEDDHQDDDDDDDDQEEEEEDLDALQCEAMCEVSTRRAMLVELQRCKRLLDDTLDEDPDPSRRSSSSWYADGADPLFRKFQFGAPARSRGAPPVPGTTPAAAPMATTDYARLIEAIERRHGEVFATDVILANGATEELWRRRAIYAGRLNTLAVTKDVTDSAAPHVARALRAARHSVESAAGVRRSLVARLVRARQRAGVAVGDRVEWNGGLGIIMRRHSRLANTWIVLVEGPPPLPAYRPDFEDGARRRRVLSASRVRAERREPFDDDDDDDDDDTYAVPASQLRVSLEDDDGDLDAVMKDYRISRAALGRLDRVVARLERLADGRETAARREIVLEARDRLGDAACDCAPDKCACWASEPVGEDLGKLRRLAHRAERAVATRAAVFRAKFERLAELKKILSSEEYDESGIFLDDDQRLDAEALARLDDEIAVWQLDLDGRRAIFDAYASSLVRHWRNFGSVPTSHWLDEANRAEPVSLGASWLDAVAFATVDDDNRDRRSSPPTLRATFLREARNRLVWWRTTWRDLATCRVCYEPMPRAHLLGRLARRADPCCDHVGEACVCCARDFARAALADASRVGPTGLACFDVETAACDFVMAPKWLEDRGILTKQEAHRLRRFARAARLRGGDKCWCPRGCDSVVDLTARRACAACGVPVCPDCRQAAHPGTPCAPTNARADFALADAAGWASCPDCAAIVEKTEACDHITCRCGARFCYNCGARGHDCPTTCPLPRAHAFAAPGTTQQSPRLPPPDDAAPASASSEDDTLPSIGLPSETADDDDDHHHPDNQRRAFPRLSLLRSGRIVYDGLNVASF